MHVADDADDVEEAVDAVADVEALADRILVGEVLLHERFVDDRDVLAGRRSCTVNARPRSSGMPSV